MSNEQKNIQYSIINFQLSKREKPEFEFENRLLNIENFLLKLLLIAPCLLPITNIRHSKPQ